MKSYNIAYKSEKGRKKEHYERNGDYCAYLETDSCVIVALADGVGRCLNDAEASETACRVFIEKCRDHLERHLLDEDTLRRFCEEIDPVLSAKRLMSCFSAVAWQPKENSAIWIHVGDTRIYHYSFGKGLRQITTDDHGKPVIQRVNGKVHTDHGSVITATPISSAIGDTGLCFHTGKIDFAPGECLVLCSDGMYGSAGFALDMETVIGSDNLPVATSRIPHTDDDDASVLILRRTDGYGRKSSLQSLTAEINGVEKHLPRHILLREIRTSMSQGITQEGSEEALATFIKLCSERHLHIAYEAATGILETARKRYYDTPSSAPHKKDIERMVIALQNYVAEVRRFGGSK
ncbi:MAG: protein phosphatase 2C domain-containing protein [Bacteroidales bacterium]|nr:protein phosphatase 2C domain-containing protein [Bacteroidales bacterium]